MLFHRFEVKSLSHYGYAVGDKDAGEIAIVDPEREIAVYLTYAREHGVRIAYVLETHIHADYASGAAALATTCGAELCVSGYDARETFEVVSPHRDLFHGDAIDIGMVRIVACHTPGHTPEHLSFLVYDRARSESVPQVLLSGDFLFVGSLGRPDLLGEEAKRGLARRLFGSVRALDGLPDGLEVCPAHGAGSMCGAGMSGRPSSTLGYERAANQYLDPELTEDAFVDRILSTTPPFPAYYRRMKRVNSEGAPPVDHVIPVLDVEEMRRQLDNGAIVVDVRHRRAFSAGHVPGAFAVPYEVGARFSTWAAWVIPYETPIVLMADDDRSARGALEGLHRVGLDDVVGSLEGGVESWQEAGWPLAAGRMISAEDLRHRIECAEPVRVLDVRNDMEWDDDHIEGAEHVFCGDLPRELDGMEQGHRPVAVICRSGYRSTVAVSLLERAGWSNLLNVDGGMEAWWRSGETAPNAG